jgi:hypothetical protein
MGCKNIKAQSTLEFTFAMIVIVFLIYGMVKVFQWAGLDLAQRRWAQDNTLTNLFVNADGFADPASELNADIDSALPMGAMYHGSITNGT